MAGTKTSALAALTTVADGDFLPIVDISDTTQAPSGSTKKVTIGTLAITDVVGGNIKLVGVNPTDPRLPDDVRDATEATVTELFDDTSTATITPQRIAVKDELYDARRSGVTFDGVTDDTTNLNAALVIAGTGVGSGSTGQRGGIKFPDKSVVVCMGLAVPDKVVVRANGTRLLATGTGTMVTLGLASELHDATVHGGGATAVDGVLLNGVRAKAHNCKADQIGGSAFILNAVATELHDSFAQNCLLNAASLGAPQGVVDVRSTDCRVRGGEYTASRTALSASGFAYAVAIQSAGAFSEVEGTIAEISDHGVYVAAAHTRLIGARADLNRGHGFVFDSAASGAVIGCYALSNGRETTNTYDGFNVANGAAIVFDGNVVSSSGNNHRYGFNDANNGASNFSTYGPTNQVAVSGTAPINISNSTLGGACVIPTSGPFKAITAASTSWSVQTFRWPHCNWAFQSVGAVNFTDFTSECQGMILTVLGDGNTTIVHNTATIRTLTGANTLMAANTMYQFINRAGVWWQIT